jgi:hypothetical protein
MSNDSRKARGMRAQVHAAAFLRPIFPWVNTVSGAASGRDLRNTPGLAVEVKARRDFEPLAWLRQSLRNSGDDMPIVIWQPDGMGEKTVRNWPYMGYLGDFREMWAELKMLRDYVQDKDPGYYAEVLKAVGDLDG